MHFYKEPTVDNIADSQQLRIVGFYNGEYFQEKIHSRLEQLLHGKPFEIIDDYHFSDMFSSL